jgi:8-oxo-dGTP pyrophosphatase MutT (NUDIX family)
MRAAMSPSLPPSLLSHAELDTVIRLAPLIAIDLIIRNARDEVLLGLRKNEPAKGRYFVPGGVILKNERLAEAFARLIKNETDHAARKPAEQTPTRRPTPPTSPFSGGGKCSSRLHLIKLGRRRYSCLDDDLGRRAA